MTVYIGNAVGDEHGKARGGEPGNQTGKELRIQPWYKNSKGWRVFRPLSAEVAQKLADNMRAACNNPCIGYDQSQRNTLWKAVEPLGFDCSKVTTPCECDCSSLVRVCLAYAGIVLRDFNTASEPERLINSGRFEELTDIEVTDTPDYLRTGDVLVTAVKGHTAIALNNGERVDPRPEPVPEPKYVEVLGRSVRVRASDSILGKTVRIVHKGDKLPYMGTAPSGWYEVPDGFITNKPRYTKLV